MALSTCFPVAALTALVLAGPLLSSCSPATPETTTDPAVAATAPVANAAPRPYGTRADSLDGMQGHHFGEPLRNFPQLVLVTKADEKGVRVYQMPRGQERGWFGKHARDFATYYQFQDGKFSMFRAVTTGIGANRTAMRQEARFLFGPGKDRHDLMSGLDWEGERVLVKYSEQLTSPIQCWLEVYSKPLLAVQQAKQQAQLQAENDLSK
jgi:hypothetical protein